MEAHLYRNSKSLENPVKNQKIPPKEEETPEKKQNAESSPPRPPLSSTNSSPAREFSFAVSLQPLSSSSSSSSSTKPNPNDRTGKTQHSFSALDLSPADDIFFHGHLLPLHLLSRIPVSPRTSTNSLDGFTLPVKDVLQHQTTNEIITENKRETNVDENRESDNSEKTGKIKQKSFSLFGLSKWRKGFENRGGGGGEEETEEKDKNKKKVISLQFSHAVKKYMRMLFHRKENGTQFRRQTQSFSSASIIGSRKNESTNRNYRRNLRGRRGEFSAPASMRTSPTNSGHLMVSPGVSSSQMSSSCSSSAADSTMEELQAAIQAAIAHCKNSIAVEDKIKS